MGTTEQDEQRDKLQTLLQDADLRRQQQDAAGAPAQGTTMHAFAQSEANQDLGRYGAIATPRVVGATPNPSSQYPAASPSHQTELPPEEPLGYSVEAMPGFENPADVPPVTASADPGAPIADSAPPSDCCQPPVTDGVEPGAGAPLSSEQADD